MAWYDGKVLALRRKEKQLTQKDISMLSGLSCNQIIAMEKGLFTGGIKYLYKYLDTLGLEITITPKLNHRPQLHELASLFDEDDE